MVKAPPKRDYPLATMDTLTEYKAFMFGIPTRYGNMPVQWKVSIGHLKQCTKIAR
jgi:NAD(P)H dehydrogenase (quinone)